ncbi:hypothetical protein ACET3X_008925 [Alternaria dauci]|uniref:Uncharacterized protein n=1 Tax=Alternaria dauci TaxID=48095 RepID=A0ABR3U8U9_9PLEO
MSVSSILAKRLPKTFKVTYTPAYKTLIVNHVTSDPSHPLHETQRRRQAERKKEGLWWHATAGVDLNKSSCIRTWARRRLRNAVVDELKARGYDETGKFANAKIVPQRADLMARVVAGQTLDLKGSLRLHVQAPLIPAKYVDIRAEAGAVIDAVKYAANKDGPRGYASERSTKCRPAYNTPPAFAQTSRYRTHKPVKSR